MSGLSINGELQSGQDVRAANVVAVCALANIVKSSLGPVGLDKMLVDGVGDVTISNDGTYHYIITLNTIHCYILKQLICDIEMNKYQWM